MSYIGLFSFYNFDNWAYQPSYVSSNTPWFFNGVRVQIFPSEKLKIEPWLVNGWQSYGKFNSRPGIGVQILYRPTKWLSVHMNQYALGADTPLNPGRIRYHSDNSVQVKYYDRPQSPISKMAFSFTGMSVASMGVASAVPVTPNNVRSRALSDTRFTTDSGSTVIVMRSPSAVVR